MKRLPIPWWCGVAFAAAVIIAVALPGRYRYLSHTKAAKDLAEQLRFGKWERIVDYIPEDELRDASLTRPQAERLFSEWLRPAVAKENKDLSISVTTTEYNSTVKVGKGLTKFEVLLTNYPSVMRCTFSWGIRLALTQVAVMRSVRLRPELQGKARHAETGRQLAEVLKECKPYGINALPPRPASLSGRSLKLFP